VNALTVTDLRKRFGPLATAAVLDGLYAAVAIAFLGYALRHDGANGKLARFGD
jgi:hypothetical protein